MTTYEPIRPPFFFYFYQILGHVVLSMYTIIRQYRNRDKKHACMFVLWAIVTTQLNPILFWQTASR